MVPSSSPEIEPIIMKKATKNNNSAASVLKSAVATVRHHLTSHPRFWLFIAFLWIEGLLISYLRTPPPCFPDRMVVTAAHTFHTRANVPAAAGLPSTANATLSPPELTPGFSEECPSGRVYAYELPTIFNKDLVVKNCTDLSPWDWECGIISNHGYGKSAAELRRFLPGNMHKSWYHTNQFTLEVIFHHRILKHKCRTMDPNSATAFYIPFYAGLAVGKHLWTNDTSKRDWHCKMMLRWVKKQNPWMKSNGSDHFMTISRITWDFRRLTDPGKLWGSSFLNMPSMQRVTRFIVEKYPSDEMDVSVPYPIGFHPKTAENLRQWQDFVRSYKRTNLATFVAETSSANWGELDFRNHVLRYCKDESAGACRHVDCAASPCSTDSWVVLEALLGSNFCLQPKGESFTRKSVFECMVAGAVPVFFWKRSAYDQYEWFLPGDPDSYSVFVDYEEVRNGTAAIGEVLGRFGKEEIEKKREVVVENIPRIVYQMPTVKGEFKDAFDVAIDGVLERIKEEKEWADFL